MQLKSVQAHLLPVTIQFQIAYLKFYKTRLYLLTVFLTFYVINCHYYYHHVMIYSAFIANCIFVVLYLSTSAKIDLFLWLPFLACLAGVNSLEASSGQADQSDRSFQGQPMSRALLIAPWNSHGRHDACLPSVRKSNGSETKETRTRLCELVWAYR